MKDPWYAPINAKTGKRVSGGAALSVRVAAAGGMSNIVKEVAEDAAAAALKRAEIAARKPHIRVVKSA